VRALVVALVLAAAPAQAALFHRPLNLPRGQWAVGVGFGVSRQSLPPPMDAPPLDDVYGFGFNLELRASPSDLVQIGVRGAIRTGKDGRTYRADRYGRTFDTETYATGTDPVANPEASVQFAVLNRPLLNLAVQVRFFLPIEKATEIGGMAALPLHVRLGELVRVDTGVYLPVIMTEPVTSTVSVPVQVWLERGPLALGVIAGWRHQNRPQRTEYPLGVAFNFAATDSWDLRAWFLMPNLRGRVARRAMGAGLGVERRF
jgi:hypothetical protein